MYVFSQQEQLEEEEEEEKEEAKIMSCSQLFTTGLQYAAEKQTKVRGTCQNAGLVEEEAERIEGDWVGQGNACLHFLDADISQVGTGWLGWGEEMKERGRVKVSASSATAPAAADFAISTAKTAQTQISHRRKNLSDPRKRTSSASKRKAFDTTPSNTPYFSMMSTRPRLSNRAISRTTHMNTRQEIILDLPFGFQ